jgi:hypothetical protein
LYDLIAVSKETVKPVGEWNTAEIVNNRGKLDLYLNGEHVVDTRLDDAAWTNLVAGSKFKDMAALQNSAGAALACRTMATMYGSAISGSGNSKLFQNLMVKAGCPKPPAF